MNKNVRSKFKKADPNAILDAVKIPLTYGQVGYMIYIDLIPVRMKSGKYIWGTLGAAKNALHNTISGERPWNGVDPESPLYGSYEIDDLLATGRLEFRKVK